MKIIKITPERWNVGFDRVETVEDRDDDEIYYKCFVGDTTPIVFIIDGFLVSNVWGVGLLSLQGKAHDNKNSYDVNFRTMIYYKQGSVYKQDDYYLVIMNGEVRF